MKKISYLIVFLLSSIVFQSCIPSLVYSPSLNLPSKPLNKDEVQILAGVGYLPETKPEKTEKKCPWVEKLQLDLGLVII